MVRRRVDGPAAPISVKLRSGIDLDKFAKQLGDEVVTRSGFLRAQLEKEMKERAIAKEADPIPSLDVVDDIIHDRYIARRILEGVLSQPGLEKGFDLPQHRAMSRLEKDNILSWLVDKGCDKKSAQSYLEKIEQVVDEKLASRFVSALPARQDMPLSRTRRKKIDLDACADIIPAIIEESTQLLRAQLEQQVWRRMSRMIAINDMGMLKDVIAHSVHDRYLMRRLQEELVLSQPEASRVNVAQYRKNTLKERAQIVGALNEIGGDPSTVQLYMDKVDEAINEELAKMKPRIQPRGSHVPSFN